MEDELDDKVLYQTYLFHTKVMSRFIWSSLSTSPWAFVNYMWKCLRTYVFKPEVIIFSGIIFLMVIYLQNIDLWSHNLLGRIHYTLNQKRRIKTYSLNFYNSDNEKAYWEIKSGPIAAYAIQGRRPKMEDRFELNENINNTGVSLFAVFDGHGGDFAANYAKEKLIQNVYNKVVEIKSLVEKNSFKDINIFDKREEKITKVTSPTARRKKSFGKSLTSEEHMKSIIEITDAELLSKLNNLNRPITKEVTPTIPVEVIDKKPITYYVDKEGNIDFGKLLTDEVLAADQLLVETAKKSMNVAGTTALIAILEGSKLIVANVGDSRGVMCDNKGNAIPLSFDHKPQQMREKKRIKEAGGFVTFNGVWRVAGILATSRALGDYPLKDKKFVIADPDILTFELNDHKPLFIILASDGLWDTFTNEEAVAFIKDRLHEDDYGAKSITIQSYNRGSLDNITVMIINFKENKFSFQTTNSV